MNGAPGVVLRRVGAGVEATFTLRVAQVADGARIVAVTAMRNPDKLAAIERALSRAERLAINPA